MENSLTKASTALSMQQQLKLKHRYPKPVGQATNNLGRLATFICVMILCYVYLPRDFFWTLHAETHMEFEEYATYLNYPVQRHEVITADGYILTVFRVQAKINTTLSDGEQEQQKKQFMNGLPVVYLQHGLLDSSDTFIVNAEDKAPAWVLANSGFDVWIGNFRGNKYSRKHVTFDPDSVHSSRNFWDFTFHEMGLQDIPAVFEYIHDITRLSINFIGHSQGSMAMLVALCEKNEIVERLLDKFIALGPIAYIEHISCIPLVFYKFSLNYIQSIDLFTWLEVNEMFPSTWLGNYVLSRFCNVLPLMCSYAYGLVGSVDPLLDQNDRYDVISAHLPAGTSLKNFMHFHQLITTYEFKQFDYRNNWFKEKLPITHSHHNNHKQQQKQSSQQPPAPKFYDFSKVTKDITIVFGTEDRLASKKDINRLMKELVNVKRLNFIEIHAGHTSFMWGKNMTYFQDIIHILQNNGEDQLAGNILNWITSDASTSIARELPDAIVL